MKLSRSMSWFAAGLVLGLVPLLVAAQTPGASAQPARISGKRLIAASEMKWVPMPGLEGAQQVALFGDPTKEAHRILYKWAPGTKAPLHTHTHGDRAVILSGTLSLAVEGGAPKLLPPGSFFELASGTQHVTAVEGDAPCVFYLEREGPFDVKMVEKAPASAR